MNHRAICFVLSLLGLLMWGAIASAQTTAPVTVHYYERRPFQYTADDGSAAGLVIAPMRKAFEVAGVPVVWKVTPVNRIMVTLKTNRGADCSAGWFRTPDRESFAQFTLPIYRDLPMVSLVPADFPVQGATSARELFAQPSTKLILKQGFVYGEHLAPLIAGMPEAQKLRVTDEVPSMVRMLRAGVGNVFITTQEEASLYIGQTEPGQREIRLLKFTDIPAVEKRHIMCSHQVPKAVIDKLNAAINAMPIAPPGSHKQ